MRTKRITAALCATALVFLLTACSDINVNVNINDNRESDAAGQTQENQQTDADLSKEPKNAFFDVSYLTKEETADVLGSLDTYYDNISQKSLDFFAQKKGAAVDEYREYSMEQACEISDAEKSLLEATVSAIESMLDEKGMLLPENTTVSIGLTTMKEASGAGGYTHGTTVFLNEDYTARCADIYEASGKIYLDFEDILAHEFFHCLTRNNPDFRKDMYSIINFTIADEDFTIPDYVHEQMIANPDVGHHDSYATFTVNGEKKDCYLVFLCKDEFENPGDSFFNSMYTGLVDIEDGSLYSYEDAYDFYEVMGYNTEYCEDPEECMATNFAFAVVCGMEGPDGEGYASPEIIEAIIEHMQK